MARRVDELRAQAKGLRKNLTSKISRMAKVHNADISGTRLDPRISSSGIDKMSSRQLQSYINKAQNFLSRDVGYVKGHGNTFIPISEWRAYKAVERENNRLAERRLAKYKDIKIPGTTMTAGEREGNRSRNPRMRNNASNRPIDRVVRENAEGITSVKALRRIRKQLEKRQSKAYLDRSLKRTRKTIDKALTKMGDEKLKRWVKGTSDEMLDFLWNYGGLAESIFTRYENITNSATQALEARGFEKVSADAESDLEETIKWAQTFDRFKNS